MVDLCYCFFCLGVSLLDSGFGMYVWMDACFQQVCERGAKHCGTVEQRRCNAGTVCGVQLYA